MEEVCFSETSVDFYYTTQFYILEDRTPHSHHYENLKSKILLYNFKWEL
jgi:hypothetical protein